MQGSQTRIVQRIDIDHQGESKEILVTIWGPRIGFKIDIERDREATTIGRDISADIQIDDDSVSRLHCKLTYNNGVWQVEDLGSTNGTYIGGESVEQAPLSDGNLIKVGGTIFKFLSTSNVEAAFHEEIYRMAIFDGLTQIHNRRYFEEFCEREIHRSLRYNRDLSLLLFDIDFFKGINDRHGHLTGDYVLRRLAAVVEQRMRREELFARYAGDEFVIVMPETEVGDALKFGQMLRGMVADTEFVFEDQRIPVTVSGGVGGMSKDVRKPAQLVALADAALYRAKQAGRNQTAA